MFRLPELAAARVTLSRGADGTIELDHPEPLEAHAANLGWYLANTATVAPDRVFIGDSRMRLAYAEAKRKVDSLSQALLDRGLARDRPLAIVAENSVRFALLKLAAMQVGVPVAPISTAYARHGGHDRLAHCLAVLKPGAVAHDGIVETGDASIRLDDDSFEALACTPVTAAVARAFEAVRPDGIAKILFTSGSTGMPKGVLTTHRMMISNIVAMRQACTFLRRPPVIVDWLPWNHCFGGNFNFNIALVCGGSYFIDATRPVEGRFDRAMLEAEPPTLYLNVPVGFERLAAELEADPAFAQRFFARLDAMFYAGSSMPAPLWQRLVDLSRRAIGRSIMIFTSYGSTESSPAHTMAHWPTDGPLHIGVPLPGCRVKLLARDGQLEIRSKGPNITPGYLDEPERTRALFDADGWMITDDAVSFVDAAAPERGLVFHGRIAGNFKLLTGTWVPVDEIRVAAIAHGAGLVRDAIICGHDRAEIGLLVFLERGCADLEAARERIAASFAAYNRAHRSASRRIGRFTILDEPPEAYERELTDKGYLNQTQARTRRAELVRALYADERTTVPG